MQNPDKLFKDLNVEKNGRAMTPVIVIILLWQYRSLPAVRGHGGKFPYKKAAEAIPSAAVCVTRCGRTRGTYRRCA